MSDVAESILEAHRRILLVRDGMLQLQFGDSTVFNGPFFRGEGGGK